MSALRLRAADAHFLLLRESLATGKQLKRLRSIFLLQQHPLPQSKSSLIHSPVSDTLFYNSVNLLKAKVNNMDKGWSGEHSPQN